MSLGLKLGLTNRGAGGLSPDFSLSLTDASQYSVTRTSEASYRDSNGLWRKSASGNPRIHYAIDGTLIGPISQAAATRKNNYAYPESGAVTDHFTSGTSDITVVTNANSPLSDDYTNNNQVWRITNSSGSPVTYPLAGTMGAVTAHNIMCWHQVIEGDGYAYIDIGGRDSVYMGQLRLNSRTGLEVYSQGVYPSATSDQLQVTVPAGMTIDITLCNAVTASVVSGRYIPVNLITPILHGSGTQAARSEEFLGLANTPAGLNDTEFTIVYDCEYWGAEQTNAGCLTLRDASDASNNYSSIRSADDGDFLWFGNGGGSPWGAGNIPVQQKRQALPLDGSFVFQHKAGEHKIIHRRFNTYESDSSNMPTGIDTVLFYRADNSPRNDSTLVVKGFRVYSSAVADQLVAQSYPTLDYCDVTVAQSNIDRKMRGATVTFAVDPLESKSATSSTLILTYPEHGLDAGMIGTPITLAGATGFDGITANEINGIEFSITAIPDANTLEFDCNGTATAGGVSGGGSGMNCNLYANGDSGGGDYITRNLMSAYTGRYRVVRGPDYFVDIAADLAENPLRTVEIGTSEIELTYPNHLLVNSGGSVTITGATGFDGISAGQLNTAHTITEIVDANTIRFEVSSDTATAGDVNGGGSSVNAAIFNDQDYGGGQLLLSTNPSSMNGSWVDDTGDTLQDGTDLIKLIRTLTYNYGSPRVNGFQIDLGPFESGRPVSDIDTVIRDGFVYLINRLTAIGGGNSTIEFQNFTARLNTDDEFTFTWNKMLASLEDVFENVYVYSQPYTLNLDTNSSNAHPNSEFGQVQYYINWQRAKIANELGLDFGNTDYLTIESATFMDASADITMTFATQNGAELVSDDTAILAKMFRVLVNDVEVEPDSASVSGVTCTLTLPSNLNEGDVVVIDGPYYITDYDRDGTQENDAGKAWLRYNSAYGLPVGLFSNYQVTEQGEPAVADNVINGADNVINGADNVVNTA